MISLQNIKENKIQLTSNIFIIPNDLFYQKNEIDKNEMNKNEKINQSIFDIKSQKMIFTDFLKPNWKKHIINYKKRNYSDYRKKLSKYSINI